MSFLIFTGLVAFVTGVAFILFPKQLLSTSTWANRLIANLDETALKLRIGIGLSLILTSACLWFIAYYIAVLPAIKNLG